MNKIILAKDSVLVSSNNVSIPYMAYFKDKTAGPTAGMDLQASVTLPVNYSIYFVINAGLFWIKLTFFPPIKFIWPEITKATA